MNINLHSSGLNAEEGSCQAVWSACFVFSETTLLFPEWVCHVMSPPAMYDPSGVCPLWYLLLLLFILVILIDVCNETSLWFLFAFSLWLTVLNIFSRACLPHLCIFFHEISVHVLCSFSYYSLYWQILRALYVSLIQVLCQICGCLNF